MCSWSNIHHKHFDEKEHLAAHDSSIHSLMGRISFVFGDGFSGISFCGIEMTDDASD
jgi:hypothetical protein